MSLMRRCHPVHAAVHHPDGLPAATALLAGTVLRLSVVALRGWRSRSGCSAASRRSACATCSRPAMRCCATIRSRHICASCSRRSGRRCASLLRGREGRRAVQPRQARHRVPARQARPRQAAVRHPVQRLRGRLRVGAPLDGAAAARRDAVPHHHRGPDCATPYSASVFNISAMSFGALSPNAILALNKGAGENSPTTPARAASARITARTAATSSGRSAPAISAAAMPTARSAPTSSPKRRACRRSRWSSSR